METFDKKLARIIEAKIRTEIVEGKYFDKPKGENITVKDLLEKYLNELSIWNRPRIKLKVGLNDVQHKMEIPKNNSNIVLLLNKNTLKITSKPKKWVSEIKRALKKLDFLKSQNKNSVIEILGYKVNFDA